MKKYFLFWLLLIILIMIKSELSFSQDPYFTQYYSSPLTLNPALAGADVNVRVSSNYRNQWNSITTPFVTSQLSFVYPYWLDKWDCISRGGLGLSILNDRAGDGDLGLLSITGTGAYVFPIGENAHYLIMGVQGAYTQMRVDYTKLIFGTQISNATGPNPNLPNMEPVLNARVRYLDFSSGIFWQYMPDPHYYPLHLYSGVAAFHLNQPNQSFLGAKSPLPMKFIFHGGCKIFTESPFEFSPNLLIESQGSANAINVGFYTTYNFKYAANNPFMETGGMILGLWWRFGTWFTQQDGALLLLGLKHENFLFGFSYDINTSGLTTVSGGQGAYEFSLSLLKPMCIKKRSYPCPRI